MRLAVLFFLIASQVLAQCPQGRYYSHQFNAHVETDVVYANSPELTPVYVSEGVTVNVDMKLDIYTPVGDTLTKRPLVMLAYGGGYLFGTKEDEDVSSTCDSLAKKGYVAVSLDYRMGLNLVNEGSSTRAMYRAAQDWSAAIRFMKEHHQTYGIDTNYVFIGGVSAGGISSLIVTYLDENERPADTYQGGVLGGIPDLGCLHCVGNSFQHSTKARGFINLWGAIPDTSWIQADETIPTVLFHGDNDLIVNHDSGAPFSAQLLAANVYGSTSIHQRLTNLGEESSLNIYPGEGHNLWGVNVLNVLTPGPTALWEPISDSIVSFLYEHVRPQGQLVAGNYTICEGDTVLFLASNNPEFVSYCWETDGNIIWESTTQDSLMVAFPTPGAFTVDLVAYDCHMADATTTYQLNVVDVPDVTIIENPMGVLTASVTGPWYVWYLNGQEIFGENAQSVNINSIGTYTVELLDNNGCFSTSPDYEVMTIGIADPQASRTILEVEFFDLLGRPAPSFESNSAKELLIKMTRFSDDSFNKELIIGDRR